MNLLPDDLLASQSEFSRALTDPGKCVPRDLNQSPNTRADVSPRRFNVYRNNVVTTMVDALGESFPTVRRLVGDEYFAALTRSYLDHDVPSSPLLFRYGATFGDFLDGFPAVQQHTPYLADIARLEFARLQAYHAQDIETLALGVLSSIPPDALVEMRLIVHPSVAIISSEHPIVSLYGASNGQLNDDAVDLARGETALVVRPELNVNTVLLTTGGAVFLQALKDGTTLGRAADMATIADETFDLATHLAALFEAGAFKGLELMD